MSDFVFFRDAVMSRDTFNSLPACVGDEKSIAAAAKLLGGRLCRALIERDGATSWHAIAWLNVNGAEHAIASRILIRTYQSED